MITVPTTPIENSYWIIPGSLLAGEYPRTPQENSSRKRIESLVRAGITCYIDLTGSDDKLEPYEHLLREFSPARVIRRSFPINDLSVHVTAAQTIEILDVIDHELCRGGGIYVHCWGGVGRTGTIIGCWLMRHFSEQGGKITWGLKQDEKSTLGMNLVPDERGLAELWKECPKSRSRPLSPETAQQRSYVESWREPARIFVREDAYATELLPISPSGCFNEDFLAANNAVADAAKAGDWNLLFSLLATQPELVRCPRIAGSSGFTPLHQAAYHNALPIAERLISLGAFRTVHSSSGETPYDVAKRRGGSAELLDLLTPRIHNPITAADIGGLDASFGKLVADVTRKYLGEDLITLPSLMVLTEIEAPRLWISVPGMYGGFELTLLRVGAQPQCAVRSWNRTDDGSGQTHLLMPHGYAMLECGIA